MKLYNYKSSYQNFSAVKWRVKEYDAGENSNYSKDNIYDTMNAVYSRINNRGIQEESMRVILSLTIGHYMHKNYKKSGMDVYYIDQAMIEYLNDLDISAINGLDIQLPQHTCSWNINGYNILTSFGSINTANDLIKDIGKQNRNLCKGISALDGFFKDRIIAICMKNDRPSLHLENRRLLAEYDLWGAVDYPKIKGNFKDKATEREVLINTIYKACFVIQCCPDLLGEPIYQDDNYKKQKKGVITLSISDSNKSKTDHLVSRHTRRLASKRFRRIDKEGRLLPVGHQGLVREVPVKSHVRGASNVLQLHSDDSINEVEELLK